MWRSAHSMRIRPSRARLRSRTCPGTAGSPGAAPLPARERTAFDEFRDGLERGNSSKTYSLAAQRGLRIFVGKGNCSTCHFGPQFTNGEFANTGVSPGKLEPGRHGGIEKLKKSPFNLLGRYNDDKSGASAVGTRHVEAQHRNFGEWRVPGLRGVARTAPYMHDGSLAMLRDVVKFKLPSLSEEEIADLVAFLESLSEPGPSPDGPLLP